MGKYINCGKWNHYYKYPFLAIFFIILYDIIKGVNYEDIFTTIQIIKQSKLNFPSHNYIHQMFNYLGVFIFSLIFHLINLYKNKKSLNISSSSDRSTNSKKRIILIHNNALKDFNEKHLFSICILTIIIFVMAEQFLFLYGIILKDLDFWMFEIVILSYINSHMFNIKVYNHQKLGLILNIFSFLFKICSIISSIYFDDIEREIPIIYVKYNIVFLGILGFVIYFIFISLRAYGRSKIKWFMDLRYIKATKLLMIYGLMGSGICFVISFTSTFIKCKDINNEIDLNNYICKLNNSLYKDDNNSTELYFENFKLYFQKFSQSNELKDIIFEIILIVLLMLIFFCFKYFSILTIQYLTPVHVTFVLPLYFYIQKLTLGIYTLIAEHSFFKVWSKYGILKYHFDSSGDILSILGFLIYLEIIELKFCKLNYNIKENIMKRGRKETNDMNKTDTSLSLNESDDSKRTLSMISLSSMSSLND